METMTTEQLMGIEQLMSIDHLISAERFVSALPTTSPVLLDPDRHVAASARPGAAGALRRLRQGNGYLPVRRMPATWRGFTGGVCAIPAVATRKHAPARGLSTWSPPV